MASTNHLELFSRPGTARVDRPISPHQRGRVFFKGTYWPARFYQPEAFIQVDASSMVTVVGRQGVTLLVAPLALTYSA